MRPARKATMRSVPLAGAFAPPPSAGGLRPAPSAGAPANDYDLASPVRAPPSLQSGLADDALVNPLSGITNPSYADVPGAGPAQEEESLPLDRDVSLRTLESVRDFRPAVLTDDL
eukprot:m.90809 g.90809  ORF g.90809 m.90809 type:complete len:115 (+) comp8478_c0_seq4:304-648(+)